MASPSSTSSSSRLFWGGIVALVLIVLVDRWLLPGALPWQRIAAAIDESHFAEAGVARDQLALARLARAPAGSPRVAVLGSSRTEAGFRPEWLEPTELEPLVFIKLAHPGMWLFAMRSFASELVRHEPDAVVFVLSDFELHYPLELKPFLSAGEVDAVAELVVASGPARAWRERLALYRLAAAALLQSYRFREVLGRAGLDGLRRFPRDPRLRTAGSDDASWLVAPGPSRRVPHELVERVRAEWQGHFTPEGAFAATLEIPQLRSLARGRDAQVQAALLRGAVRELRRAGVAVILFEAPLFPSAHLLYDSSLRDDFLALARALAAEEGALFVPLEAGPGYVADDFSDLTHLDRGGAPKLTRAVVAAVRRALDLAPAGPAQGDGQ